MNNKNLIKILKQEIATLADFVEGFSESASINAKMVDKARSKAMDIYDELLLLKDDDDPIFKASEVPEDAPKNSISLISEEITSKKVEEFIPAEKESIPELEMIETHADDLVDEPITETEAVPLLPTETEEPSLPVEVIPEPVQEVPKVIETPKAETVVDSKPESTVPVKEVVVSEPKKENPVETSIRVEAPVVDDKAQAKNETLADKFANAGPSVNDMLAGIKQNKDLASKMQDRPIKDLKKAIKLNDRIWFINELFQKNAAIFEATVAKINNMDNLDTALEYIFTHFKWDQERKSTISFLELVFRRFAS